jgi:hypothetical protein
MKGSRASTIIMGLVVTMHSAWAAEEGAGCTGPEAESQADEVSLMQMPKVEADSKLNQVPINDDDDGSEKSASGFHPRVASFNVPGNVPVDDSEDGTEMGVSGIDPSMANFHNFVNVDMRFSNTSAKHNFLQTHATTWKQLQAWDHHVGGGNSTLNLLSTGTRRSTCAVRYTGQFFSPRIFLCGSSFTGITSCTENGCYVLASVFYPSSCHAVYYSNAESSSNGFGMCRCMPSSVYSISRYYSSSGNNIYSCSSIV